MESDYGKSELLDIVYCCCQNKILLMVVVFIHTTRASFRDKRLPYPQRVSLLRSILQFLVSSFDGEDPLSVKRIIYGANEKCLSSCTLTWIYLRN